jgi:hypothetical protein
VKPSAPREAFGPEDTPAAAAQAPAAGRSGRSSPRRRLTRKQFLVGTASGALGLAGLYALVDRLAVAPPRRPAQTLPPEQHLLQGVRETVDNDVLVLVPPLHHAVLTFAVASGLSGRVLRQAQRELETLLVELEGRYEPTPAGLGITVAWGLPYFQNAVPELAERYLPFDGRASAAQTRPVRVLIDAVRFPSDPEETILEQNAAAVLLRSDHRDAIEYAATELTRGRFWQPTSLRRGFVGGGLPKQMALAAGVPGAELIPDTAELFLGFTSTQKNGLGPERIANIETLGYSDGGPGGYFRGGTTMHLSHLREDIQAWYSRFTYSERADRTFQPGITLMPGTLTITPTDPVAGPATVERNLFAYRRAGAIGHAASLHPASRLQADVVGPDGTLYKKNTAIPQRADFNTLDNPFYWTADPDRDQMRSEPAAGLHFVVFHPTSDDFHRNRLAMDGVMPDGTTIDLTPRERGQGMNSVLHTTHRQNFLVPPRRHRAFPLAELLA